MPFVLDAIKPQFGARISGVDLRTPLDPATIDGIARAAADYGVLVFADQPLSQEELVRLGESFGPVDTGLQQKLMSRVQSRLRHQGLSDISNVDAAGNVADAAHPQSLMNVGNMFWHSDASYEHHPFRFSILSAVTAASRGGETEFADLCAAYEALDAAMRRLVADTVGTFYSHNTRRWLGMNDSLAELEAYPPVRWPLVRTHPETGRRLLWVDSKVSELSGMSIPEGRALVHELLEHIGQRERVYRHHWTADDVVMWDNRRVVHRGRRFDRAERREMRRVSTVDDCCSLGYAALAESG